MRRLVFASLLTVLIFPALHAQNVEVEVKMGKESLPYAYVLVNRQVVGSTDQEGIVKIPAARLNKGDTLTACYIGSNANYSIFKGGKKYTITLESYVIDPVVVTHRGPGLKLQQVIKPILLLHWCDELSGNLSAEIVSDDGTIDRYNGHITFAKIPRADWKSSIATDIYEMSSDSSTNKFSEHHRMFYRELGMALNLGHLKPRYEMNDGIKVYPYDTLATQKGYTLVRDYQSEFPNCQLRVWVDTETKVLQRLYYYFVTNDGFIIELNATYKQGTTSYISVLGPRRLYPDAFEATIKHLDTGKLYYACKFTDGTFSDVNTKKYWGIHSKMVKEENSKEKKEK